MKKEEIMMKHCSDNGLLTMAMGRSILKAMDEYAEQQIKNLTIPVVMKSVCGHESVTWNNGGMVCDACGEVVF